MLKDEASSRHQQLRVFGTLADVPREPVSQDPLGFAPSAERLADEFAPGLTVSTRSIRYFQLLACGVHVAAIAGSPDPRAVVLRLERIWALASYLSKPAIGDKTGSGLAGISRVRIAARPHNQKQQIDYSMFRGDGQARLGVWDLYRRSAEHLLLVHGRQDPTPLGQRIAAPMERAMGSSLRGAAVRGVKSAATATLTGFGDVNGLWEALDRETAEAAWDALRSDPSRRAAAMEIRMATNSQEDMLATLAGAPQFAEAARAAQALEIIFVALSRLIDTAVKLAAQSPAVDQRQFRTSPILRSTLKAWKRDASRRCDEMAHGAVDRTVRDLGLAVADATDPWEALLLLTERHHQVQEAKARQPWLQWRDQRLIRAAATPVQNYDPFDSTQAPTGHDFRLVNLRHLAREIHQAGVHLT